MKRIGSNNRTRKIRENNDTLYFKRRLSDLERIVKLAKRNTDDLKDFLSYIYSLLGHLNNGGENYDRVKTIEFIVNYFKDDIEEVSNRSNKNLNESVDELRYRRRIKDVDKVIKQTIGDLLKHYGTSSFCYTFTQPKSFLNAVIDDVTTAIYYAWFSDMDDDSDEWGEIYNLNHEYISKIYGDRIIAAWNDNCR